ncbi:4'-phosphopantetheinyl transferase family protein [Streptomyces sp. H27-D2]|uniref:4'-phosphopantetheinyl transferase family protein n=1 Tax=Streptomyces sp. H27-D2 TaxID=3046304 RepID=UPI002DB80D20|nr:4'-phosphopantetheinyl transferase superfamily protein [Streptomyces sp. H27-D2]MEC4016952.1 4'-phosphopantetheinyl transferase superfamily protein [Streptomyces sp. H27-D2]
MNRTAPGLVPRLLGSDPLPTPMRRWEARGPHLWLVRAPEQPQRQDRDRAPRPDHGPLPDRGQQQGQALDFARDTGILDTTERARAAAFVRDVDRDRYVTAHVALRRILGAYLGADPARIAFIREPCPCCGAPHGRPAVEGTPLHFSLSHARELVLIGLAGVPVGVDVEEVPSPRTATDVAATLHPTERTELSALPAPSRPAAFSRCWTRKEAYLKGTGTGLAEDPSITYVGAGATPAALPEWTLTDVRVDAGYTAACAERRPSPAADVRAGA